MTDSSESGMTAGRPPDDWRERDFLDDIDEAVAGITEDDIEDRLRDTLRRAGYAICPSASLLIPIEGSHKAYEIQHWMQARDHPVSYTSWTGALDAAGTFGVHWDGR
jgi:hypothetical protein